MRALLVVLLLAGAAAHADDTTSIRWRRVDELPRGEPLLHLDITPLAADAEGGSSEGHASMLDIGPRARLAVEGRWWKSGLAPSMFEADLENHGWRAAAELSYDLGPFSVGVNASMMRNGDSSHRAVGLFAFRRFRLSRWMHAWILLGFAYEQYDDPNGRRSGTTAGFSIGTTFR